MIFDDHDVTDDWNLSALWETTAYEHPFSRRIIGNALLGYLLCQGWGNQPQQFAGLLQECRSLFQSTDNQHDLDKVRQDALINQLLHFNHWHYKLATSPKLVVLEWLDRLNRWLFAPWSPLNWFTKRRHMKISPQLPEGREAGERLWNASGIGDVRLDETGSPTAIRQLNANGGGTCFRGDRHDSGS